MTPYICQVKHNPPESYGDCLRACIASLLDMDPPLVPHFADKGVPFERSLADMREWLKPMGLSLWLAQLDGTQQEVMQFQAEANPDIHYLLFGAGHVVICRNEKVAHDTAWYRVALERPEVWTIGVLVRL